MSRTFCTKRKRAEEGLRQCQANNVTTEIKPILSEQDFYLALRLFPQQYCNRRTTVPTSTIQSGDLLCQSVYDQQDVDRRITIPNSTIQSGDLLIQSVYDEQVTDVFSNNKRLKTTESGEGTSLGGFVIKTKTGNRPSYNHDICTPTYEQLTKRATSRRSGVESGPSWVSAASNYNIAQQSQSKAASFSDHERKVELRSSFTITIQTKTSVDEDDATSFPRPRFEDENDERGSDPLSNAPVSSSLYAQNVSKREKRLLVQRLQKINSVLGIPLNFLLIVDSIDSKNYINILDQSSREAIMDLDYSFLNVDGNILCEVYLMGNLVGLGTDHSKVLSKQAAARKAVKQLKKHHYSLMKKAQFVNSGAVLNTKSGGSGTGEDTLLSGNNIGLQMMKKMGWTGSGLGQNQQGIVEPIQTEQMNSRAGFGIDGSVETQQTIRNEFYGIFKDYACSDANTNLVFSANLSSFKRKSLHELARKFNLKSISFGKRQNRKLVVSKSTIPQQILYDLLLSGQKENEKYILIEPEGMKWNDF